MVVVGAGLVLVGRHVLDWRILRRCGLMCLASIGTLVVALITRPFGTATAESLCPRLPGVSRQPSHHGRRGPRWANAVRRLAADVVYLHNP
jgi:hypothetical protein